MNQAFWEQFADADPLWAVLSDPRRHRFSGSLAQDRIVRVGAPARGHGRRGLPNVGEASFSRSRMSVAGLKGLDFATS